MTDKYYYEEKAYIKELVTSMRDSRIPIFTNQMEHIVMHELKMRTSKHPEDMENRDNNAQDVINYLEQRNTLDFD